MAGRDDLAPPPVTGAHAWIAAQLAAIGAVPAGPLEPVRERPWATVLRVPTDRGPLYFKTSSADLRHEAAVTEYLGRRAPDLVPPLLAVDRDRGWMLMADAGRRLSELVAAEGDVSRWLDVLPAYGRLQVDLAGSAADLVALGAPDMRLAVLPARFAALLDELDALDGHDRPPDVMRRLRAAVPRVAALCEELAGHGIPETIQHDDLSDGAVYVHDGRYRILDWGDACVSHPLFSMSVTLEGVIAWGPDDVEGSVDTAPFRDAYLAPFAAGHPERELRAAFGLAVSLGWVCRAVNGHVRGMDPAPTWTRLRMFLDGRP
jgi:hypothetical protein